MLFVKPQEYRGFAMPVKLFEYIGRQKPIIASHGTLSGEFVADNDIGWSIAYNKESLKKLLRKLLENKYMLEEKNRNVVKIKEMHNWKTRALQVEKDLLA
jgi:glycosyltransferase involved in cell wall biosynthesis